MNIFSCATIILLLPITQIYAMNGDEIISDRCTSSQVLLLRKKEQEEKKSSIWDERADSFIRRSKAYYGTIENIDLAKKILEASYEALKDPQYAPDKIANIYFNMGIAWDLLGDNCNAFNNFKTALSIKDSKGYEVLRGEDRSQVFYYIGIIYDKLRRYDEATEVYKVALQEKSEEREDLNISLTLPEVPYTPVPEKMRLNYIIHNE